MTMRSCKAHHRSMRTALATFAAAVLALSTLAPQSLAYAVEAAQNMAAGGGRALVVVEEGFNVTSFSQAGLTWEALVEAGGSDVSVADIQADAESDVAEAAVQGDVQAQDMLGTTEGAEAVSTFDLAASVADEAQEAGMPAQTGASYRKSASLSGIYLVTCPTLDAAQVVQRASALEGVLFAEADQVVAEGSSDVEDGAAALEEGEASATAGKDETADGDAAIEDDGAVQEDAAADGAVSGDPAADDSPAAAEESADAAVSTEEGDAAAAVAEDAAGAEGEDPIEEKAEPLAESATSERVASADLTDLEWYLGSSGGMRDAADPVDLNIPAQFVEQAAAVDDPPVIAVVDTGVDYTNPALAPSMVDLSQYPGLMEDTGCGKYGIVGFVAAGNFATNVDESENLLSAVQQGSTVVVDSDDTTGDTSWFSNYGKINTDVFSPGSSILATRPTIFPSTIPPSPSATARRSSTKGSKRRGLPATPTMGMSALIAERMTDFTELPLPDFAEYEVAESGSLAYWDGDIYLETVSIPEDSYLLDYYRYDTAARTWEHVGTIDTGSKDAGAASGLAVAGDQLYRFRNDGPRLVDNVGPTMALYRFDRDADAFDPDPVELSAPVGTAHAIATWGDRLIVIADDAKGERFDLLVLAIDPASGTVEELGALPTEAIGIHSASVSKGVLYVHVPGDALDASDVDRLCVCPLDDIESARLIDLPATDSDTPYSAQVAASNGDAALLGLPGILDSGEATNSDVWKVVEGAQEATPTHVVLQAGGSTELASVIAGDMLYVWGVSRAIDERTFFRCLPLSALGMEAEGTASEEGVPPASVDEEPLPLPGDPSAMASTGDGAGYPLAVAAILALVSAGAAGTAFRRTRTSSSDRWPRSRER